MNFGKLNFTFLIMLIGVISLKSCNSPTPEPNKSKAPNVLLVISDDQSWLHTSITGDKVVKTPAFDRVAEEGILFTNAFSACPCSCELVQGHGQNHCRYS